MSIFHSETVQMAAASLEATEEKEEKEEMRVAR